MIQSNRRRLYPARIGADLQKKSNICVDKPNICAIIRDRKNKCSDFFRKEEAKMTSTFIIVSILEVAAVALIITGFVFEKKLINFEEKFETALAKKIAHFLCTNKYTKAHFVKEKKTAQRRSAAKTAFEPETVSPTPGRKGNRVA